MGQAKQGSSLFEAMSKTPQVQYPKRRPGLLAWWRRRKESPSLTVAQPLTEEEAAAELAERRAAEQAANRAKEPKRPAKDTGEPKSTSGPFFRMTEGRFVLSLNTAGCIFITASICVLMLGAYSLGRHSTGATAAKGLPQVAAVKGLSGSSSRSPLLSGGEDASAGVGRAQRDPAAGPDLSELLKQPPAKRAGAVTANEPAVVRSRTAEGGAQTERLNYLQIESFRITRARSSEQLKTDVADVQAFLAARGVETFARFLSNGYVLFSKEGFPPSPEYEARREAFRKKIEQCGREYRRGGGLYQFKGCLFVSYSQSRAGRPAS